MAWLSETRTYMPDGTDNYYSAIHQLRISDSSAANRLTNSRAGSESTRYFRTNIGDEIHIGHGEAWLKEAVGRD